MKRHRIVLSAAMLSVLTAGLLGVGTALALTYEITIYNEIPGGLATGQPFSPPVVVVHDATYSQWMPGAFASPGLITVAEEGNPAMLAMEAEASAGVAHVVVGDGPFFDPQVILIEGQPGDLLSVAWMLGRTNDLISGLYDVVLPDLDTDLDLLAYAYDAGSEVNTGLIADLGFYGNPMTGPDESNPIALIDSYTVYDDPDYGVLSWDFPPCGRVVIVPMEPTATTPATWSGVKALFD
jgi:hypothetical protein